MTEEEILLTSILNCSRTALYTDSLNLNTQAIQELSEALYLRSRGFPLQYILGETEFFGLKFKVDRRVFIPRPETEILVETAIKYVTSHQPEGSGLASDSQSHQPPVTSQARILDIGTGSGCIAIGLAKFLPQAQITAIDVSKDALEVAKENAILNSVSERISFVQSDLFTPLETTEQLGNRKMSLTGFTGYGIRDTGYDIIVSNPPYIRSSDIKNLQRELNYEPRLALDGGSDGLNFYRRLIKETHKFLKREGWLLMEMGFGQSRKIENILQKSKNFEIMDAVKDYSGIERVLAARRTEH